ncbi:unnamed protein product, partial [Allacma fusca]
MEKNTDTVLEELNLAEIYRQKFYDENLDDGIFSRISEDDQLKDELRSIVTSADDNDTQICKDFVDTWESKATIFVAKLLYSGKIPQTVVTEIIDWTKELLLMVTTSITKILSGESDSDKLECVLTTFQNPFKNVDTSFKLEQHLIKTGNFIEPEEIVLGTYHKVKNHRSATETSLCKDTFQYVPAAKLVKK